MAASVLVQDIALAAGPDFWRPATNPGIIKNLEGPSAVSQGRWGQATHHRRYKDADLIINIQDAHSNLGAQTSIGRALDEFGSAYDLELIGVEGSSGRIDSDLIASLPDARVRSDVADGLLRKTMISAAEYRQIVQGGGIELFGVEDPVLHRKNARDFGRLLAMKAMAINELAKVRAIIETADMALLPADVHTVHKSISGHADGRIQFADHWELITRETRRHGADPLSHPSLAALDRALELERGIDFEAASVEREMVIRRLKSALRGHDRKKFFKELLLFQKGKMRPGQFHRLLLERARKHETDPETAELQAYSDYLSLYEKISLPELFNAVRRVERMLIDRMLRTSEERGAYARVEAVRLLGKLFSGEMTTPDLKEYLILRGDSGLAALKERSGPSAADWPSLFRAERIARAFYMRARSRDRAMLDRLTARMREKGVRTAALVAGGFHTEGLTGLMEERRLSHVVVLPEFSVDAEQRPYATVIRAKGAYLDRAAREAALAETIAAAIWSASVQGVSLPRIRMELEKNAQKIGRRGQDGGTSFSAGAMAALAADAAVSSDRWIAPASVLANVDVDLAARMAREARIEGSIIRVGGHDFEGSVEIITTEQGVRRRRASVRPMGEAPDAASDALRPIGQDAPVPVTAPETSQFAVRTGTAPVLADRPAALKRHGRTYRARYLDLASGARPAAGARMTADLIREGDRKSRSLSAVFWIGGALGAAMILCETFFISDIEADPLTARYVALPADPGPAGKSPGQAAVSPRVRDGENADREFLGWVTADPLIRQKVRSSIEAVDSAAAEVSSAAAAEAALRSEEKEIITARAEIDKELDALEAKELNLRNIADARKREIAAASEEVARIGSMLAARRRMARAEMTHDPVAAEKMASAQKARADAAALRSQAAEATGRANTSSRVAREYQDGGKFIRRLAEGFSFGFKGPVPEISITPFAGKTQSKLGQAMSEGERAEALIRAQGAWEQAELLDRVAESQETALRAYQNVRSVASEDALDPEIAASLRGLHDINSRMIRAEEEVREAVNDASALDSARSAIISRIAALGAREETRLKMLESKELGSAVVRNRLVSAREELIASAAAAVMGEGPEEFAPELASEMIRIGTRYADPRFLPIAAELLLNFERRLDRSDSNPAQRRAAQELANDLLEYFEATLASGDAQVRGSSGGTLKAVRGRMDRDMLERPLARVILKKLQTGISGTAGPSAPARFGRPLLLADPGLQAGGSVSNAEHHEERSQIQTVLAPIAGAGPQNEKKMDAAFLSGDLGTILDLAASSDEQSAVSAVRKIAADPDLVSLLADISRDTSAPPRVRAAAIEAQALERDPAAPPRPANDPLLSLIDGIITEQTPGVPGSAPADPFILSRTARLAGSLSPSQALPFLERIIRSGSSPAVYAAVIETRSNAASPEAVRPLLDALFEGKYAYHPKTRHRVLNALGLWSDRSPVQTAIVNAVLDLSSRFKGDAAVRAAIDEYRKKALETHRMGLVEYVLDPARRRADPSREPAIEDLWSGTAAWFYNRFDMFAAFIFVGAGIAVLLTIGRKVRGEVEGSREIPKVRGYDEPHRPESGTGGARMAGLDLEGEAERILMRSLEARFSRGTAEMIRTRVGSAAPPSDASGWMTLFPELGAQILSELRAIRTSPIDLIESRLGAWERALDSDASVAPSELSASIFALFQQLMIRLPRRFDHQNFYKKLADTRDGVINIRTVARTVKALQTTDELLRREWKRVLEGKTSILDRDAVKWSLMALQRQHMKAYRAFGAAQELFELAHVALTYNDYRMHPWLMKLFVFESMKRKGVDLLTRGPGDPARPELRGVLDDYYRAIGQPASQADIKRDVKAFMEDFSDDYRQGLESARIEGNYVFSSRVVGRRYRRLITVLMPAFGIAAGFLLGGPVFGLPALLRAFFLGSLGLMASRWIHKESFYKPLMMNYEHYANTVVNVLAERNRLFASALHIAEFEEGRGGRTYIESDAFVSRVLLNSARERRKLVIDSAAAERPADLLIVMAGDPASERFEAVRRRVLSHELVAGTDTPVIMVPDDPGTRGSYGAFLKAHASFAGGVSVAQVVQRMMREPWFVDLNPHLLNDGATAIRDDVRRRLQRDHHRKIGSVRDAVRIGVLYAGGEGEQLDRVAGYLDESIVRIHAALLWAKRSGRFLIANEYADGRYAGPLPFYDSSSVGDLETGEALFPLTWVSAAQIEKERAAVFLPDPTGRDAAEAIPGGLNADERRTRMDRAWMRAESPFTKFQLGSDAPQFLTDTGAFYFVPGTEALEHIRDLYENGDTSEHRNDGGPLRGHAPTVEQFFVERLRTKGLIRTRVVIPPPDASRYDQSVSVGRSAWSAPRTQVLHDAPRQETAADGGPPPLIFGQIESTTESPRPVVARWPSIAPPLSAEPAYDPEVRVDVLMDGRLRLMGAADGGVKVILGLNGSGYHGVDLEGVEWAARWGAGRKHFVITNEHGATIFPVLSDPVRRWIQLQTGTQTASADGARMATSVLNGRLTAALERLLGHMMRPGNEDISDEDADEWIDAVIVDLPLAAPHLIQRTSEGYRLASSAVSKRGLSERGAPRMMGRALTASSSRAQAVRRAEEAVRSLVGSLLPTDRGDQPGPDPGARDRVRRALKEIMRHYRAGLAARTTIAVPQKSAGVPQSARIMIEEELYLENPQHFDLEADRLSGRLNGSAFDLDISIIVPVTPALSELSPMERERRYRQTHRIGGPIKILFTDPAMAAWAALEAGGRPQAVLTQMASDLAQEDMPSGSAVIELHPADGAVYTGALFAAAKLLISGDSRLPGVKKIARDRYFYFSPMEAGALLRMVAASRMSAAAADSAA